MTVYFLAQLENHADRSKQQKVPFKQKKKKKSDVTVACGIKGKQCMFYIQIICTHHQ